MRKTSVQQLCACGLLIAIGTLIPIVSPVRLVLPTMSFTLASHVAIFIAMMMSPTMGVAVSLGTTAGFLIAGFPLLVVLRAASHVVFALFGGMYLQKRPETVYRAGPFVGYSLGVSLIHAACEALVVTVFYFGGLLGDANYAQGFMQAVLLLVGVGTLVHSLVDLGISYAVVRVLEKQQSFTALLPYTKSRAGKTAV